MSNIDLSTAPEATRKEISDRLPISDAVQALVDDKASLLAEDISAIEAGQVSGVIGFTDKATMEADTERDDGTVALVSNDATPANNGWYRWTGSEWVKNSEFYTNEVDPANTSEAVTGKAVGDFIDIQDRTQGQLFTVLGDADGFSFKEPIQLLNVGDKAEIECKVTDFSQNNHGLLGRSDTNAQSFIGFQDTGRIRVREDNGDLNNLFNITKGRLLKISVEVITDRYRIVINDGSAVTIPKNDKIVIDSIGLGSTSGNNFVGIARNFKFWKQGDLEIQVNELFTRKNVLDAVNILNAVGSSDRREAADDEFISPMAFTNHVQSHGQSLSIGTASTLPESDPYSIELYNNATFAGGVRAGTVYDETPDALATFKPLVEERSTVDGQSTRTETHISSMLNFLSFRLQDKFAPGSFRFFGSTSGAGGASITNLGRGSTAYGWYEDQIKAVESRTKTILNWYVMHAIVWAQGEADYATDALKTTYHQELIDLLDDMQEDYEEWTENVNELIMPTYQLASHKYYQYRDEVGGTPNPDAVVPYIALELKKAGEEDDRIYTAVPTYIIDHVNPKNLHPTIQSYNVLGAYYSKVIRKVIFEGEIDWKPLAPLDAKNPTSGVVNVKFHVPYGKLEFDDVNEGGRITPVDDFGFELWSDSGRHTIDSVKIVSNDTVRIRFTDTLGSNPFVAYAFGTDIEEIQMGRTVGPRGQLRDTEGDIEKWKDQDGNEIRLDNFCLIFSQPII